MYLSFTLYKPIHCVMSVDSKEEADAFLQGLKNNALSEEQLFAIDLDQDEDSDLIWENPDGAYLMDDDNEMVHNYSQDTDDSDCSPAGPVS